MTAKKPRQIVAMGGGGFSMEPNNPLLDEYVLSLVDRDRPRVCFVPTASGDADGYIRRFYEAFAGACDPLYLSLFHREVRDLVALATGCDVLYVGGGNTVNQLAVWRAHGFDRALRAAWEAGVVLCGVSAGFVCWFESGVTDSYGPGLAPLQGGLGLLPGSGCPHYDGEPGRRPTFQRLIAAGELAAGYAADDGVALHFVSAELAHVVASRPGAAAYRVERRGDEAVETTIAARYLGDE